MSRLVVVMFWLAAAASSGHAASVIAIAVRQGSGAHEAVAAYATLQAALVISFAVLVALRGASRRANHGPGAVAACAVALASAALMRAPDITGSVGWHVTVGDAASFVGTAWVLVAVSVLGRCFGILPEARGLVTRGPYRFVRHPVYLGELVAAWGLVFAAPSSRNMALGATLTAAQFARMRLEERELLGAFPQYSEYARATPRLLPRPGRAQRSLSGANRPSPRATS